MTLRTTINVDQEKNSVAVTELQSKFFTLKISQASTGEINTTQLLADIISQLNAYEFEIQNEDTTAEKKSRARLRLGRDLISALKKLPHRATTHLLAYASAQRTFTDETVHAEFMKAITQEKYLDSPLLKDDFSVESLEKYKLANTSQEKTVENFLSDPEQLLLWMNKAPATEVAKLIKTYFSRDEKNNRYTNIRKLAQDECDAANPGIALLCYTMICPGRLTEEGIKHIDWALARLQELERPEKFNRVIQALRVSTNPTPENIRMAGNSYLNLNKLTLPVNSRYENLKMGGGSFKDASLDYLKLNGSSFTKAMLDNASIKGAELIKTDFSQASLRGANLSLSVFTGADLRGTDLTNADLGNAQMQGADLTGAILENTKLDGVEFFKRDMNPSANPNAFSNELSLLLKMVTYHKYEVQLRDAILNDVIRYAKTLDIVNAQFILNTAEDKHDFFKNRSYTGTLMSMFRTTKSAEQLRLHDVCSAMIQNEVKKQQAEQEEQTQMLDESAVVTAADAKPAEAAAPARPPAPAYTPELFAAAKQERPEPPAVAAPAVPETTKGVRPPPPASLPPAPSMFK